MRNRWIASAGLTAALVLNAPLASGVTTFAFGTSAGGEINAISGQSTATMSSDGVTATFTAGPIGAVFDDRSRSGLGINTRGITDVLDGEIDKLNLLGGTSPLAGQGESIAFWFDQPGVLNELLFDGVKDETLEYFILELPDGTTRTIFDSEAGYRLGVQGFTLADVGVTHPVEAQTEDDNYQAIDFAYRANEIFTLTYGQSDFTALPGYRTDPDAAIGVPNETGNGARFQGVVITVPEPAAAGWLAALVLLRRRRIGRPF